MDSLLPNLNSLGAFLALIFGFGFIVFVHELGHFLVAKWVGIKVEQFAVGFGHALVCFRKGIGWRIGTTQPEFLRRVVEYLDAKGEKPEIESEDGDEPTVSQRQLAAAAEALGLSETEYRLNWMPLGGYVKMLGQDDLDPSANMDDDRAFNRKPIWARACVISAGVIMNIIFGVVFFIICFLEGVHFPPAVVGDVSPSMPAGTTYAHGHDGDAEYQGLKPADVIMSVDGKPVRDFMDFRIEVALAKRGQVLDVAVDRGGTELTYPLGPVNDPATNLLAVGVAPPISLTLGETDRPGNWPTELAAAGIEPKMTATKIGDRAISHFHELIDAFAGSGGEAVEVTFKDEDSGETVKATMAPTPGFDEPVDNRRQILGLVPAAKIKSVKKGSPAAKANLQAGDVLMAVAGAAWPDAGELSDLIKAQNGKAFAMTVLRDGRRVEIESIRANLKKMIGISYGEAADYPIVVECLDGKPAAALNLPAGSKIISIDGQPVGGFADLQRLLAAAAQAQPQGGQVAIEYEMNVIEFPRHTKSIPFDADQAAALAAAPWRAPSDLVLNFEPWKVPIKADTPTQAASLGIEKAHQFMLQTYITIARLFQRTIKPEHLRGPVGILHEGTRIADEGGWPYLVFFLGIISVNLAVINFLPIPITDGGLMVFLIIEKLKGSPVSPKVQQAAFFIGLAMIGSIFALTLYYDTGRLFGQ